MPDIIQQLLDLKEWSQDSARYERRMNFRAGQLVQPGPGRQGYDGKIQFSAPDDYPGTTEEWEALDRKKRFRWRHPEDIKKWNIKRQYSSKIDTASFDFLPTIKIA